MRPRPQPYPSSIARNLRPGARSCKRYGLERASNLLSLSKSALARHSSGEAYNTRSIVCATSFVTPFPLAGARLSRPGIRRGSKSRQTCRYHAPLAMRPSCKIASSPCRSSSAETDRQMSYGLRWLPRLRSSWELRSPANACPNSELQQSERCNPGNGTFHLRAKPWFGLLARWDFVADSIPRRLAEKHLRASVCQFGFYC